MNKIAKIIRIITVPTVVLIFTILVSNFAVDYVFVSNQELYITLALLVIVPMIAYPLSYIIGRNKEKEFTRKIQRKLAFIFSLVGYTAFFILSFILNFNKNIMVMSYTYFLTIILLTITNLFIKASGHAAGTVGPMLLLCYYFGWIYTIPCIIVYALSFWASIYLKRHTVLQFVLGTLIAVVAFFIPFFIYL